MENFIKEHDYAILVYAKEDTAKYTAAIKALTETKKMSGWDRVQGVTIHKGSESRPYRKEHREWKNGSISACITRIDRP